MVVGVLLVDVASVLGDEQRDDVVEAVDGGDLQRGPAVLRHAVRAHRVLRGQIHRLQVKFLNFTLISSESCCCFLALEYNIWLLL